MRPTIFTVRRSEGVTICQALDGFCDAHACRRGCARGTQGRMTDSWSTLFSLGYRFSLPGRHTSVQKRWGCSAKILFDPMFHGCGANAHGQESQDSPCVPDERHTESQAHQTKEYLQEIGQKSGLSLVKDGVTVSWRAQLGISMVSGSLSLRHLSPSCSSICSRR